MDLVPLFITVKAHGGDVLGEDVVGRHQHGGGALIGTGEEAVT